MAAKASIVVVEDNARGIKRDANPSYPVKLRVYLEWPRPRGAQGTARSDDRHHIVVIARSRDAMNRYIQSQGFRGHERLLLMVVTEGDQVVEQQSYMDRRH